MSRIGIEEAIDVIAEGGFVIVVDDEDRENEGDLIIAAEKVTQEKIAFMVRYTSGLICQPMLGSRLDELGLPLMVLENTDSHKTAFTVSVDYAPGTTTGISAADRAETIKALVDTTTRPTDLNRPGHIFPLRYREGGVLLRPGHTEAAVDLARLAGLTPSGVLCEIVNDDGTMARGDQLMAFSDTHDIPLITIADLVAHRWRTEAVLQREVEASLPTIYGDFRIFGYRSLVDGSEHVALVMGDVAGETDVLTRTHSECLTGDTFMSLRCDCRQQLEMAMHQVAEEGTGVIVYNRGHEGRGIGLLGKLAAYRLQDEGRDTVEANLELGFAADARHFGAAGQILNDLKITSVRLMTNNPNKISQLEAMGIEVSERVPAWISPGERNGGYLKTKAEKLGHLGFDDEARPDGR